MRMIKFQLDVPFTAEEVARAVVRLKGRKALGVSFIRPLSSLWSARKYEWIVRHRLVRLVMKLVVEQRMRPRGSNKERLTNANRIATISFVPTSVRLLLPKNSLFNTKSLRMHQKHI